MAITQRFWELRTIEEISRSLRMDWDSTDRLIDSTIDMLRRDVGMDPAFLLTYALRDVTPGQLRRWAAGENYGN